MRYVSFLIPLALSLTALSAPRVGYGSDSVRADDDPDPEGTQFYKCKLDFRARPSWTWNRNFKKFLWAKNETHARVQIMEEYAKTRSEVVIHWCVLAKDPDPH